MTEKDIDKLKKILIIHTNIIRFAYPKYKRLFYRASVWRYDLDDREGQALYDPSITRKTRV